MGNYKIHLNYYYAPNKPEYWKSRESLIHAIVSRNLEFSAGPNEEKDNSIIV